jgi:Type II CAAX prenyl endopeptidase Rce1-like
VSIDVGAPPAGPFPLHANTSIGASSLPLRCLIAALTVGLYIGLGFVFHLNTDEYQLTGIPILLAFQVWVHRQPLRTLWVRAGPPIEVDPPFVLLWLLFSLVPAYDAVIAIERRDFAFAAFAAAAIGGAFGLAYALRAMRTSTVRQLALCTATVGALGVLPQLAALLLPHLIHLHIAGQSSSPGHVDTGAILKAGAATFLLGPVGFMVEEVFFRGALDTYVHGGEKGTGWISAAFVSALWGLWHLPGQAPTALTGTHVASTIVALLVAQIVLGVPLSLWWRASGNLVVTDTAHAFVDAVRSSLSLIA